MVLMKYPLADRAAAWAELLFNGARSTVDDLRARAFTGRMSILPEQFTVLGGEFAMRRERSRAERRHSLFPRFAEMGEGGG